MKKVLLLGAMAFFAINIANAQSNVTISSAQTNEEAIKIQKEQQMNVSEEQKLNQLNQQNQASTPKKQSATRQNTTTGKVVRPGNNSAEVAPNNPTEATAAPSTLPNDRATVGKVKPSAETTDTPQQHQTRRFKKPHGINVNGTASGTEAVSNKPGSKQVKPNALRPKPSNVKLQSTTTTQKTDK